MTNSYLDLEFPWYQNGIKTIKPSGMISLRKFISAVISPKPDMIEAFKLIQEAGERKDKAEKDRLKTEKLFFTTPSVKVDPIRNYESIKQFLPFAILEYDDIAYAEELRDYIFEKRKDCIFAFVSPSKTGSKFIFHIETPKSIEHYKQLYFGIVHDLDKFKNLDLSNERVTQPLFNSYDPNAKFREDAIISKKRGYKENAFDANKEIEFEIPEKIDEVIEKKVVSKIYFLMNRVVDNAHPQLLGLSFLIGGWSGANFIGQELAYDTMVDAIEQNDYMSKNVQGYLLTAKQMFLKGLNHPAEFKTN